MEAALKDINKGDAQLKKTETVDKSAPKIEAGTTIKKNERGQLLADINKGDAHLKKTETADRSAPVIEKDTTVKKNERGQLLADIQKKKTN